MWINGIVELFVDAKGKTTTHPPGVHLQESGRGDEKYYYDVDGHIHHVPPRTKYTHPYSYDAITLFNNGDTATSSVYSDRMAQWDYEKFRKAMEEQGELGYDWHDGEKVTKMCQTYFDNPTLQVVKVVELCNVATGYPVWHIMYTTKEAA